MNASTPRILLVSSIVLLSRAVGGVLRAETASSPESGPAPATRLYLKAGAFDPARRSLDQAIQVPESLAKAEVADNPYYILQFAGPVRLEWKERLMAAGVEFHDYVPDYAFLVKMSTNAMAVARTDRNVRWMGRYEPRCKVAPAALACGEDVQRVVRHGGSRGRSLRALSGESALPPATNEYTVILFDGGDVPGAVQALKRLGAEILEPATGARAHKLRVRLSPKGIPALAQQRDVKWIEPAVIARSLNNIAACPNACDSRSVGELHGLFGQGETVAVADTGLDRGTNTPGPLLHDDFEDGEVPAGSRIVALLDTAGDGNTSDESGHGTHVVGSVLGNGSRSGAVPASNSYPSTCFAGIAPKARCVVQAGNRVGPAAPSDLNGLFGPTTNYGARIHSDSWSYPRSGFMQQTTVWWYEYGSPCQDVDEFMWNHSDFLVVFAAGNDGVDLNRDGRIDCGFEANSPGQINLPGTAKNCVTVGATESLRLHGYGGASGEKYVELTALQTPTAPIADDHLSDHLNGVAAFSSRGPTEDHRIKPDLVAPGGNILSACSDSGSLARASVNTNYAWLSGTSMAAPLVAGAAALVREFFDKGNYPGITNPSAALVKAVLLNGATSLGPGQYSSGQTMSALENATQEIPLTRPNNVAGWGRVNVFNSLYPVGGLQVFGTDLDPNQAIGTGETNSFQVALEAGSNARVTLTWTDYPGAPGNAKQLVNDLDLEVLGPGGPYYAQAANPGAIWQMKAYDTGACGWHDQMWFGQIWSSQDWCSMIWGQTPWWSLPVEFAKRFTPSDYPATLEWVGAMIMVLDYPGTNAVIRIHDDDGTNGLPGTVLASTNIFTGIDSNPCIWHQIPVPPVTVTNGNVWVGIRFDDQNRVGIWTDGLPMGFTGGAEYISQGTDPPTNWVAGTRQYMIRAGFRCGPADNTPYDRVNNVEGVDFVAPVTTNYTIRVIGHNVPQGHGAFNNRQPFALVVSEGVPGPARGQSVFSF